ncbi:DUF2254 domain-containing protein [Chelativorans salis]|uniref:DUF2254 domain-containing protein n=1 Tax=Chelativorans salis TaxID=2978478 RepID=A0ABT2LJT4_9HYPH|nr:DUF2254 domain-containing protein [Chelativorans sp. EGI FJ00035]MCT7374097.1 DUF2254 domain-containing protein [Chelativorans sp. EGI FJ00035]
MMDRARNLIALLRTQLWPIPAVITLLAAALAYLLLTHGAALGPRNAGEHWWLYSGEARTARQLLSSLLSGLMTMTSLVVSVTFVILTLAANQLGPRLISIFMADRQIQTVLGVFIGTILYVILIMRVLDDELGSDGVPHLAVTAASVLTILCLLALLFYIHKIARLIIADNVVEAVAKEFRHTLHSLLPDGPVQPESKAEASPGSTAYPLHLNSVGYLQVVDYERLVELARKRSVVIEVNVRAGHFILRDGEHVRVFSRRPLDESLREDIRSTFTIGSSRTPAQDPEHGVGQLVEIATRALSPGMNDPFTARAVIDRLGAAFEVILTRHLQPRLLRDGGGAVRVMADRTDIDGLLDAAFHPIRQAGADHPAILIRIADIVRDLAAGATAAEQKHALIVQLLRLAQSARLGRLTVGDRKDVARRIKVARRAVRNIPPAGAAS